MKSTAVPYLSEVTKLFSEIGSLTLEDVYTKLSEKYPGCISREATKKAVYRLVEKGIVEERGRGEYACRTADDLRCECGGRLVFDERHYEYVCLDCGLVQEAYLTSEGSKILSDSHTPIKPFRTKKDFRYNGGKVFLQRSTLTKEEKYNKELFSLVRAREYPSVVFDRAVFLLKKLQKKYPKMKLPRRALEALVELAYIEMFPEKRVELRQRDKGLYDSVKRLYRLLAEYLQNPVFKRRLRIEELFELFMSRVDHTHQLYEVTREVRTFFYAKKDEFRNMYSSCLRNIKAYKDRRIGTSTAFLAAFIAVVADAMIPHHDALVQAAREGLVERISTEHAEKVYRYLKRQPEDKRVLYLMDIFSMTSEKVVIEKKKLMRYVQDPSPDFMGFLDLCMYDVRYVTEDSLSTLKNVVLRQLSNRKAGDGQRRYRVVLRKNVKEVTVPLSSYIVDVLEITGVSPSSMRWHFGKLKGSLQDEIVEFFSNEKAQAFSTAQQCQIQAASIS